MRIRPVLAFILLLPWPGMAQHADRGLPASESVLPAVPAAAERTASGLASLVLRPGQGGARPGSADFVTVQYSIWTADGKLFENTAAKEGPVTVPLDRVMKGMAEGIRLMTEGERRRLWIPPELGFPAGKGLPSGPLVMEVELLYGDPPPAQAPADVAHPPANATLLPSGLAYRVLRGAPGSSHPGKRDHVTVNYSGWTTDGKLFDSSVARRSPDSFQLGEVIQGWTEGIPLLAKGQKARFWIPEKLAYQGSKGKPAGMLVFDVELLAFWH